MPSKFKEDLPISSFEDIHEYPVSTATYKAVDVYERLVVSGHRFEQKLVVRFTAQREDPENAPDLVIGGE